MRNFNEKYVTYQKTNKGRNRTIIACPVCGGSFSIREFKEHVRKVHPLKINEIGAMLLGLEYPVKCSKCHRELNFDLDNFIYPTHCKMCHAKEKLMNDDSQKVEFNSTIEVDNKLKDIDEIIKNAKAEKLRIKRERAKVAKKEAMNRVKIEDLKVNKRSKEFLDKLVMNLRVAIAEHNWNEVIRNVNIVSNKLKEMR